jgi:hypothetical protein
VTDIDQRGGLRVDKGGDVVVLGDLKVRGRKQFIMTHPLDPQRLISYVALEGPEAGTFIRGTGSLVNGKAIIELPEHFGLVTAQGGLTVALSPLDEWLQLYVIEKSTKRIVVGEARGKNGRFDYLLQGIRKGNENYQAVNITK